VETTPAQKLLQELLAAGLVRAADWDRLPAWHRQRLQGASDVNRLLDQLCIHELLTGYQAGRIRAKKPQWLVLGDYRVLDRLGAGCLGVVFKAEHIESREPAAIKVLVPTSKRESSALVRLLAERHSVSQVQHPNIVRVLDVGEAHSDDPDCPIIYYYVMQYVSGADLEQHVQRQGPLTVAETCNVGYEIASALAAAHRHKVVHRDLKPSNVVLTDDGHARLLDFGLVRSFNAALGNSQMQPARTEYLAPEQLTEIRPSVDVRTDLYSLGATLCWCLTGKPPFAGRGERPAQLAERAAQPVPDLAKLGVEVPEALGELLATLLAVDPAGRPGNPVAVMQALNPLRPEALREEFVTLSLPEMPRSAPAGRVLLVEPDADCRAACAAALAEDGLATDEADNGRHGLELALAGRHDVLVLAAALPDLGGVELLRYVHQQPDHARARVLVVNDDVSPEAVTRFREAGADECLLRPVDRAELRARVQAALERKHAADVAAATPVPDPVGPAVAGTVQPRRLGKLLRPLGWLFGA
jgi:CheY-like chemotaxis protein